MAVPIFCNSGAGINTALGCIPVDSPDNFIKWLLPNLLAIIGGVAFLIMIWGGIQIITAAGNPDKIKAGGQMITSAITGLLFTIFSLFILRLIGIDILHIPGLQ